MAVTKTQAALLVEHDRERAAVSEAPARDIAKVDRWLGPGLAAPEPIASHRASAGGLPVPTLATSTRQGSTYYTVTTVDARGRLADRSPLRVLRWAPRQCLNVAVEAGALIAAARPDGTVAVTRQGHLRLPADLRHALRLDVGDRLLVAAYADHEVLVAYTMPAVDAMVSRYHANAVAGTVA